MVVGRLVLGGAERCSLYWGNSGCFGADLWGWGHAQPAHLGNPQRMALCFQGSVHGICSCLPKTEVPAPVFPSPLLGACSWYQTAPSRRALLGCLLGDSSWNSALGGDGSGEVAEPSWGPGILALHLLRGRSFPPASLLPSKFH